MSRTIIRGILLLQPRDRSTFNVCAYPEIALDEFAVFPASTGVLNPFLNAHCNL
jgi:hypothetical protein